MKPSEGQKTRLSVAITMLLCVWSLSGCVGATRLPARSRGPAGENLQKKELDLAFLEESGTRREEVLRRLSPIDTAYANPRLFWGRWSDSKWGYWWFIAAQTDAVGDAKRVWHVHNLLVSFDEEGAIQKKMVIGDEPALWRELHAKAASAPPLSLPREIPLAGWRSVLTDLTLTTDALRFTRNRKKNRVVEISPLKIARISHDGTPYKSSSAGTTCHTLHFAEKTELGRSFRFCAGAPDVAAVFQYISEQGSKDLGWE